jgi:hypothetical protein
MAFPGNIIVSIHLQCKNCLTHGAHAVCAYVAGKLQLAYVIAVAGRVAGSGIVKTRFQKVCLDIRSC